MTTVINPVRIVTARRLPDDTWVTYCQDASGESDIPEHAVRLGDGIVEWTEAYAYDPDCPACVRGGCVQRIHWYAKTFTVGVWHEWRGAN